MAQFGFGLPAVEMSSQQIVRSASDSDYCSIIQSEAYLSISKELRSSGVGPVAAIAVSQLLKEV